MTLNRVMKGFLMAVSLLPAGAAFADGPLTAAEAVRLALARAPEVSQAESAVSEAALQAKKAVTWSTPLFSLSGGLGRGKERGVTATAGQLELSVKGVIYSPAAQGGAKAASLALEGARYQGQEVRNQLASGAWKAYWSYVAACDEVKRAQKDRADSEKRLANLKALSGAGLATNLEVARGENALLSATLDENAALTARQRAAEALRQLIGQEPIVSEEEPWTQIERLELPGSDAADLGDLPSVKGAASAVEAQKVLLSGAKRAWDPDLIFSGQYGLVQWNDQTEHFSEPDTWRASLAVSWQLNDGGVRKAQLRARQDALKAAEEKKSRLEQSAQSERLLSARAFADGKARLDAAKKGLNVALEARRLAEVGYGEGVATQLDWLTAKTAVAGAERALTGARMNLAAAWADYWLARGQAAEKLEKAE